MAKANLTLPNGTIVTIEGTPEEVASLLERFSGPVSPPPPASRPRRRTSSNRTVKSMDIKPKSKGVTDYIRELREEDFFREPRSLNDVRAALAARAHIYPVTTLSPTLFRLVRGKELRRDKDREDKQWKYVNW